MKFVKEENEIFWRNLSEKHKLTQHEYRVLINFVSDSTKFDIAISTMSERLDIKSTHVSRALKSLVNIGILKQENKKYVLNPAILKKTYQPKLISGTKNRKEKEQNYKTGTGNWKKKVETKKINDEEMNKNFKKMIEETRSKNKMAKSLDSKILTIDTLTKDILDLIKSTIYNPVSESELDEYNFKNYIIDNNEYYLNENRKIRNGNRKTIPLLDNALKYLQLNNIKPEHWITYLDAQIKNEFLDKIERLTKPYKIENLNSKDSMVESEGESTGDLELDEMLRKMNG